MHEIALILGCSTNKVVYWMDKYKIKRRTRSEATYIKRNPNGDPFLIKKIFRSEDMYLYGLGLGIFWGEGEKTSKNLVRVTNSDPYVLLAFSKFLRNLCGVKPEKMRYSLICFNDTHPTTALNYWLRSLKLSREKFGKIVQIPPQGKGRYKRKSSFGVCTLTVSNVKLKEWIINELSRTRIRADIV